MFKRVRFSFAGHYLHGVSCADNFQWHPCTGGVDLFFFGRSLRSTFTLRGGQVDAFAFGLYVTMYLAILLYRMY